jgi:regulation of enolase protein 1 (concanavalin A-like superfamily)
MKTFTLPGMPAAFAWHIEPESWRAEADGSLIVRSGPKNDYFHDPASGKRTATAPCALMELEEPSFILSTHASLVGAETFDAAVIFVRSAEESWAKFCVENSPARVPTIVSVVTRGVSDDCNGIALGSPDVFLRVAKTPSTLAFHYSLDASYWHLVRYFSLGALHSVHIGLVAQSPLGQGCEATFSNLAYRSGELGNLRDGQ